MSAAQYPAVSVIMPVLNEERHLRNSVRHILEQEYPGEMEVVIALGPSADRTDEIAAELVAEDCVHTVPNPTGRTPAALNAAIKASRHPVVVRVDGHGMLSPNYIATAVRLLEETGAQNVGGIMHAEGENAWEDAVAAAMTSKIGVGNAASTPVARRARPRPSTWASSAARPWSGRTATTSSSSAPRTGS